jgi:hypothetical protein
MDDNGEQKEKKLPKFAVVRPIIAHHHTHNPYLNLGTLGSTIRS